MPPARALALLTLAAAAAPGSAGRPARAAGAVHTVERFEYTVSIGAVTTAAAATIEVHPGRAGEGRILAEVRPAGLLGLLDLFEYRLLTVFALPEGLPRRASRRSRDAGGTRFAAVRFDHGAGVARGSAAARGATRQQWPIDADTFDLLSALVPLREIDPDGPRTFTLLEEGVLYRVTLRPGATERLTVPAGEFDARRIRVEAEDAAGGQPLTGVCVWLSRGPRRLPLRLVAETPFGGLDARLLPLDGGRTP